MANINRETLNKLYELAAEQVIYTLKKDHDKPNLLGGTRKKLEVKMVTEIWTIGLQCLDGSGLRNSNAIQQLQDARVELGLQEDPNGLSKKFF